MIKSVSSINIKQNIVFRQKPKYSFATDLVNSSGLLTKEEKAHFNKIKQNIYTYPLDRIKDELFKNYEKIMQFIQANIKDTHMVSNMLIYNNSEQLSDNFIKQLKLYKLFQTALSCVADSKSERKIILYPSNIEYSTSSNNKKNIPVLTNDPLLIHPIEIAKTITGWHDTLDNSLTPKLYKNMGIKSLLNKQEQILKLITDLIKEKGSTENFTYTNYELKNLNTLITRYNKLNMSLKKAGINSDNLETLLSHPLLSKDIKIGDKLPNGDLVIDKTQIYDIEGKKNVPAIMTFVNTNIGFRLKLYRYDDNIFNQIEKIRKQYGYYKNNGLYSKINDLNQSCFKIIKDSEIAEVFFQEKNAKEMKEILSEDNIMPDEVINKYIQHNEKYIFIRNLKNYNRKKYYNTSLPLIKNLKLIIDKNQMEDAFIKASSYDNVKHSPAALYIRAGCEPISHTTEEVLNMLNQKDKACDTPILFVYHTQKN